jgi:hypothetical protein
MHGHDPLADPVLRRTMRAGAMAAVLLLVASHAGAAETVSGLTTKARAEAKRWKADAVLVEINAHPQPDGTLGPGHGASFMFRSPSTGQALMVGMGGGQTMSMPMPGAQSTLPIPERVIDLTQALAAAHKQGFGTVMQASLKVYPAEGANRVAWELGGLPTGGAGSGTMYVDAISGTVTSFADMSGRASQHEALASLREQEIAVDAPIDFATLRQKADAMAASQSPAFKLHQVEVELASSTLRIEEAVFHYSRGAPPRGGPASGWEEIAVHVWTPRTIGAGRTYTRPGKIMGVHSEFSDPRPTPAPAGVLAPDEAIRRLNREPLPAPSSSGISRDVKSWRLHVQLINVGAAYSAGLPGLAPTWREGEGSFGGRDAFFNDTAPKGTWVWFTITQHPNVGGEQLEYVYIDAVTGRATSHCGEPQGRRLVAVPCAPPASGGRTR